MQQEMIQTMIHQGQNKVMIQWRQWLGLLSFTKIIFFSAMIIEQGSYYSYAAAIIDNVGKK